MPEDINKKLPSLRSHYLVIAALVTILLLIGTGITSWYINNVSENNTSALAINKTVTTTVLELRNVLSNINMTMTTMLIHPESSNESILNENLNHAIQSIATLNSNRNMASANLEKQINLLFRLINDLNLKIHYLIQQRKNQDWVYPILPYINAELLVQNRNFITATELAIAEYTSEGSPIDETFFELIELRNLWQKKILNFRAVIVRFAGLNNTERTSQEEEIEKLHSNIETILDQLNEKKKNDELALQVEASLYIMIESSRIWNEHWNTVKEIKNSNLWRGDITYLNQHVIPIQKKTALTMRDLELMVHNWSAQQTDRLSYATQQISTGLWILALLAISFVIGVYLMIEKLVLSPTARITKSLSQDRQEKYFHIEDESSKEIYQLTNAFNQMRSQIHQRQLALEHQALHDILTGLPNRALLNDRLTQSIYSMNRTKDRLAVFLLDLDRFKDVNDTLGHHVGDQLLQLVSKRLEDSIRSSDTVARLGGDEFAIIAPNTEPEEAFIFANKIIATFKDVFTVDNQNLYVNASIGISIYPDNGTDNNTLIRHADTAMYIAKNNNYGVVLYEASQDKNTTDNLSLVSDLHDAIKQDHDLFVVYQPQVDLRSLEVIQIEALLRWKHPCKGYIPPEEIISLAEQTGVIQELTTWIINTAMQEYMQHMFKHNIRLSINLSTWNLQDPDLPSTISGLLELHRMPANMLTLEITETTMMYDPVHARQVLEQLSNMGIILAIDDYGTGFSSLSYLKLLPMHELKIDKSFIFDMLNDENDAIIVKSTIELAHNLGFKVIAEGVENNETLLQLRSQKCDYIQGYYLSEPQRIYLLIDWLDHYRPQVAQ